MYPAAKFVQYCGMDAIEVCREMEKVGKVGAYSLKPLEAVTVPEDWQKIATQLLQPNVKATAARLKDIVTKTLMDRWWQWVLMHPELGPEHIHPSRSMHHFPSVRFFFVAVWALS